jgi:hypothetical protein
MYQIIHERIGVGGVYNQSKFIPRKFLWRSREYLIKEITFVSDFADGGIKKRQYSVIVNANCYRLIFDRTSEVWFLEEVWCE